MQQTATLATLLTAFSHFDKFVCQNAITSLPHNLSITQKCWSLWKYGRLLRSFKGQSDASVIGFNKNDHWNDHSVFIVLSSPSTSNLFFFIATGWKTFISFGLYSTRTFWCLPSKNNWQVCLLIEYAHIYKALSQPSMFSGREIKLV